MTEWQRQILERLVSDDTMEAAFKENLSMYYRSETSGPHGAVLMFNSEIHSDNLKKYWHASVSIRDRGVLAHPDTWSKSPKLEKKAKKLFALAFDGVGVRTSQIFSVFENVMHSWIEFSPEEYALHERFLKYGT